MTIYLVNGDKAFTDRQLAESYLEQINHNRVFKSDIKPIELVTDQFMEQILQPKESHETNTNSSLAGSTMRQSNIFGIKFTWFYYNNQSEFLV